MIVVAKVEALLSIHGGQADALRWLHQSSHITTMLDINERAEGSMEQQYPLGHWLPRSPQRRTHGFSVVCIKHATRLLALYRTQLRAIIVANTQAFQLNSAYFASIDTQPLQAVRATDQVQYLVGMVTSFLPHLLRQ